MTVHDRMREKLARRPELAPREEALLQEHLAACPDCRETAEAYSRQTALLRAIPVESPPPALRAGVLAGITTPRPIPWWHRRPQPLAFAPVGAMLLLIAGIFAVTHRPEGRSTPAALNRQVTASPTSTQPQITSAQSPTAAPRHPTVSRHRPRHPTPTPASRPSGPTQGNANPSGAVALGPPPTGSQQTTAVLGSAPSGDIPRVPTGPRRVANVPNAPPASHPPSGSSLSTSRPSKPPVAIAGPGGSTTIPPTVTSPPPSASPAIATTPPPTGPTGSAPVVMTPVSSHPVIPTPQSTTQPSPGVSIFAPVQPTPTSIRTVAPPPQPVPTPTP